MEIRSSYINRMEVKTMIETIDTKVNNDSEIIGFGLKQSDRTTQYGLLVYSTKTPIQPTPDN